MLWCFCRPTLRQQVEAEDHRPTDQSDSSSQSELRLAVRTETSGQTQLWLAKENKWIDGFLHICLCRLRKYYLYFKPWRSFKNLPGHLTTLTCFRLVYLSEKIFCLLHDTEDVSISNLYEPKSTQGPLTHFFLRWSCLSTWKCRCSNLKWFWAPQIEKQQLKHYLNQRSTYSLLSFRLYDTVFFSSLKVLAIM